MRLLFIFILVLTAVTDARTRKIPDLFPTLIVVLALCRFVKTPSMLLSGAVRLFAVSLSMLLLALLKGELGGGDIKDDPEATLAIIELDDKGENYQLKWGLVEGGKPTSELPSHLMNHAVKKRVTNGKYRVI